MPSSERPESGHPDRRDPHDPRSELDRHDNIVLLALGESVDPAFDLHRSGCVQCQADIAAYTETVGLARESSAHRVDLDAVPPPSVWAGISAELGLSSSVAGDSADAVAGGPSTRPAGPSKAQPGSMPPSSHTPSGQSPSGQIASGQTPRHRRHRMRWRTTLVAVAAAVVLAAGVGTGYLVGQDGAGATTRATAQLSHMPGGPAGVTGTARVRSSGSGEQLIVSTTNLPLRQGYYQVWLYNPTVNNMIPVGALASDGTGTFPVPGGVDVRSYHVVDVSAQDFTGTDTTVHKQSVLQGPLTQ